MMALGIPELLVSTVLLLGGVNNPVNPCPTPLSALKARVIPVLLVSSFAWVDASRAAQQEVELRRAGEPLPVAPAE